jgi:transposase-like protein
VLNGAKEDLAMLMELSIVEQRYEPAREVLDTMASVTDVATRYGIDRRTLHRWLVRDANQGLAALAALGTAAPSPIAVPTRSLPRSRLAFVELRIAHPGWSPRTILNQLRRELEEVPSRSAIYRCLVRHRLIEPKPRRR